MDVPDRTAALKEWEKKWSNFIQGILEENNVSYAPSIIG